MSSTQLDQFAAAALQGLLTRGGFTDYDELAREAFQIARAMMAERLRQSELPDSEGEAGDLMEAAIDSLELPLRVIKKLRALGVSTVRDLTLTTEKAIRATGLKDESMDEIRQALHRLGLNIASS